EHDEPPQCDRWPDDPTPGLCHQSTEAEARRGDLRLDQDSRVVLPKGPPGGPACRVDVHLCSGRVQPGPDSEPDMDSRGDVIATRGREGPPAAARAGRAGR